MCSVWPSGNCKPIIQRVKLYTPGNTCIHYTQTHMWVVAHDSAWICSDNNSAIQVQLFYVSRISLSCYRLNDKCTCVCVVCVHVSKYHTCNQFCGKVLAITAEYIYIGMNAIQEDFLAHSQHI